MIKKEKLLLILNHRLTNIRHDHLHHITSEIVKREPSFICIEDLNVNDHDGYWSVYDLILIKVFPF